MRENENIFLAKAAISSYLFLAGIHFIISLSCLYICITSQNFSWLWPFLIFLLMGCGFVIWLNGFKISIDSCSLNFRDGFYKKTEISLIEIKEIKHRWVDTKYLWRILKMPRLVITYGYQKSLEINSKPFIRKDMIYLINYNTKRKD